MIDTPKEAATGDKAARDLMLSELLQVCTQEDWKVSGASIYALDKSNGNNLFYASIRKESKHCSAYEILANAKLIALAPTIAAELIKERAVNAKLLEALKDAFCELAKLGYSNPRAAANLMNLIKQAEALNGI